MASDAQLQALLTTVATIAQQLVDLIDQLNPSASLDPATPTSVTNTALTDTTADFSIQQAGTPAGWNVYKKLATELSFPSTPTTTVAYSGSPTFTLTGLAPNTAYDVAVEAYSATRVSAKVSTRITTTLGIAPTAVTNTAVTDSTATFSITQTGTVDGWNVYIRTALGSFPTQPNQVVAYSGSPTFTVSSLNALTTYDVGVSSFKTGYGESDKTITRFQTTDTTTRTVTISAAEKAAAIAAAGAAADGSKDVAFTNSLKTALGSTVTVKIVNASGPTTYYTETAALTNDVLGLYLAQAGTFGSSSACDPSAFSNLWLYIEKTGDATKYIRIPAGGPSQADAKYIIDTSWANSEHITRTGAVNMLLPNPAFDTAGSGGGGGGGSSTVISVSDLVADMVGPNEAQWAPTPPTGLGNGTQGFIQMSKWELGGIVAYDTAAPNANYGQPVLPWLLIIAAQGHVDDGNYVVELWDFDAQIKLVGSSWAHVPGYPTSNPADIQLAFYTTSTNNSWITPNHPVLSNGHIGAIMASSPEYGIPNGGWMAHNGIGPGGNYTGVNVECFMVSFRYRLAQRPGRPTFDPSKPKLLVAAGFDPYPYPYPGGYIVSGNMGSLKLVTSSEKFVTVTQIKGTGIDVRAARNASIAAAWPKDTTWLAANKPLGVS